MRINDVFDIAIVAIILYFLISLVRETRAMQLLKGIAMLGVVLILSRALNLTALNYIINTLLQYGAFALIVIFQPELRTMLERMGRFRVGRIIELNTNEAETRSKMTIASVAKAAADMSKTKTGALIVLERGTKLGEFLSTGTQINADVSSRLLENIFVPNTPLHDGAVIIRDNKILTAGCVLPLTANNNISPNLGTRHRAALGLSEVTDAVIVVVSEETGTISIALNASLTRNLSGEALEKALIKIMSRSYNKTETFDMFKFWRSK
ncbi:MAG: diadenylate cyclase CdaA [Clostridiales bacterium]|nr:diadenylate cyclase CdaA [Clostridiales bacterium]